MELLRNWFYRSWQFNVESVMGNSYLDLPFQGWQVLFRDSDNFGHLLDLHCPLPYCMVQWKWRLWMICSMEEPGDRCAVVFAFIVTDHLYSLTNIHRPTCHVECSLTWLEAGHNMLGGGILRYRTDCGTIQNVLLGAVHSRVLVPPAAWQIFSYKWGAAGRGNT